MEKGTRFEMMSNGNKLIGYYRKPEGEGKFPTVIVSHGFSSNTNRTATYAEIFFKLGYATVIYDFTMTGTGESEGPSTGMSALTEKADLLNLLEYVKTFDGVDTDRITLAGCSMGGFVSALAGPEVEDQITGLILFYPAFCIPEHLREGKVQATTFDVNNIPDEIVTPRITIGGIFARDCINMDENECTRNFKKPVLIVHGLEDYIVPVDFARRAAEGYADCVLKEIHGDHGFNNPDDFAVCEQVVKEYLGK